MRVLRLGSFSLAALAAQASQPLPAPIWMGPVAAPAAPYLGTAAAWPARPATAPVAPATPASPAVPATSVSPRLNAPLPASTNGLALLAGTAGVHPATATSPVSLVSGYLPVPIFFLSPTEEPDAPLDSDFPATGPGALVTDSDSTPESATWIEALDALQTPAVAEAPATSAALASEKAALAPDEEADAPTPSNHAALGLPAPLPSAPNLNFQIIQYARFAVPTALAEQPFSVLYAPSWPTWLAAQELRQRTGRPLVLHLAALAAGTESAETATGWVAELQRQALRRADLVLVETHALASRLRRELSLPAHAVRVVPVTDTAAIARALHRVQTTHNQP